MKGNFLEVKMRPRAADEEIGFPVRINRFLALSGIATRREADKLILKGHVRINGTRAVIGHYVREGDRVEVDSNILSKRHSSVFFALWKPAGVDSDTAAKAVHFASRLLLVGRLSKNDEGLMLLTDDFRAADLLQNPAAKIEQEYIVRTQEQVNKNFLGRLEKEARDQTESPVHAKLLGEKSFAVRLSGGRQNLQRICESLHRTILGVKRTRIGPASLHGLSIGSWRKLSSEEVEKLRHILDI